MAITHATSAPGTPPPAGLTVGGNEWNAAHVGGVDISALAGDLLPSADDTYDIGSTSKRWSEGHFSDFVAVGTIPATSGVLRLKEDFSSLFSSNPDAGSGWIGGDVHLLSTRRVTGAAGDFVVSQFGHEDDLLTSDICFDPLLGRLVLERTEILLTGNYAGTFISNPDDYLGSIHSSLESNQLAIALSDASAYISARITGPVSILEVVSPNTIVVLGGLPSSDPGGNGLWINAANHNAVTIGSGA